MSALESAVAGRPGWEPLPYGNARYTSVRTRRWVVLDHAGIPQEWMWDVYADGGNGSLVANGGSGLLDDAMNDAEQAANR